MRILYHHRTLGDGAEGIHIAAMVEAFRALGHEVLIGGPHGTGQGNRPAGRLQRLRAGAPDVVAQIGALGYNFADFVTVSRQIDRFRPDLVYTRHARFNLAALEAARRSRLRAVLETNAVYSAQPYADFEPLLLRPLARAMERRAFVVASAVVAVSTPMASQVSELSGRDAYVLRNGVDTELFDPQRVDPQRVREQYAIGNRCVIGWSGILRAWHGIDLLVKATQALPTAVLLIIGDGPDRAHLEQAARRAGVADRLVVTGRIAHRAMPDHLAAIDIAVIADDLTGVASPMKLAEYMAMGRAVVAPRTPAMTELIDDGATGILFERGNAASLSDALRSLSTDRQRRLDLGTKARDVAVSDRSWKANAQAVIDLAHTLE